MSSPTPSPDVPPGVGGVVPFSAGRATIEAQVRADVEGAIADARERIPHLPEYDVSSDPSGKRLIVPVKAMAIGMLDHLLTSYKRTYPDWED